MVFDMTQAIANFEESHVPVLKKFLTIQTQSISVCASSDTTYVLYK